MEFILITIIVIFVLEYNQRINSKKFIQDNSKVFQFLKEDDYDFLVRAKYGDSATPEKLFDLRIRNGLVVVIALIFLFLTKLNFLNFIAAWVVGYLVFKQQYAKLKTHYRTHLHEIDMMLPYYLKGLEILIQHYTVPVALGKSVDTAPEIFKPGLKELVSSINSGDSSIDPYMQFAKDYPVRDSMRMMRLLYRLGLGSNENKHEQLLTFSKSVSSLQNKSREMKYKARLDKMEKKTMLMLVVTGGGAMILLLFSIFMMMRV